MPIAQGIDNQLILINAEDGSMRWRVKSSQYDDEFMLVTIKFQFLLSIRMSPFNDAACFERLNLTSLLSWGSRIAGPSRGSGRGW